MKTNGDRRGPGIPRRALGHLAQGSGSNDVVQELHSKPATQLDGLHMALAGPWEGGEEEAH